MSEKKYRKDLLHIFTVFLMGYLGCIGYLWFFQDLFLYPAGREKPIIHAERENAIETVKITTHDGLELEGWFYNSPSSGNDGQRMAAVVYHGNAGNIGNRFHILDTFKDCGMDVLLTSYRGYGGNPGKPSEEDIYSDAKAFLKFLINNKNYDAQDIVLYGESLGTGVAIDVASDFNIAGLVLESPYKSILDTAKDRYFFVPFMRYLLNDHFRSDLKITDIKGKKLFLIGSRDTTVLPEQSLALFNLAEPPKSKHIFEGARHSGLYDYGAKSVIQDFVVREFGSGCAE